MAPTESTAVIFIGGPASGKTTIRKRDYAEWDCLDSDTFKMAHPDYDPRDPSALHEWSGRELQRAFFRKIGTGESFVLDGTGTSIERYATWMTQLGTAGYRIEIVYVKTTLAVALKRNANRKRNVPEYILREKYSVVATAFDVLSSYANKITAIDNS